MIAAGWDAVLLEVGVLPFRGEMLGPAGEYPAEVDVPCNVLLLRRPGHVVLVDAGAGPYESAWPGMRGDLAAALATTSCDPESIDTLVLTHLDFDHAGGAVTAEAARALPDAVAIAPAGAVASVPREHGRGVGAATDLVAAYGAAGMLRAVEPGEEFAPGLVLADAPGHRAGHCVLEVGGELLHLADIVHDARHVIRPEWDVAFDDDTDGALRTRRRILAEAAERDVVVVASHVAGVGRIGREADGMRWMPA